jgi:putative ATP-dependent endonuclease of OLD family
MGHTQHLTITPQDDLYFNPDNPSESAQNIECHLTFEIENDEEAGVFYELLSVTEEKRNLKLSFRFYFDKKNRFRWDIWGGDNEGQSVTSEVLELFYYVYLGALRDALSDLRPSRGNRTGEMLVNLTPDKVKQSGLAGKVQSLLREDEEWQTLIGKAKKNINEHLDHITLVTEPVQVDLSFLPYEFKRIAENLRIHIPLVKDPPTPDDQVHRELNQVGLGFNNLIFMSTVMGDLATRNDIYPDEYRALFIEEPEAHIQPQLQNILYEYIESLALNYQVFVTSHSPTITSKADLSSLTVLSIDNATVRQFNPMVSGINQIHQKYLERFLDVTKSQLLFAKGVILVEGISEALLLHVFAKVMGLHEGDVNKYSLIKHGVEIVNVGGLSFDAFAKLFNEDDELRRLSSRCGIITDTDKADGTLSARAITAQALEGGNLKTFLSNYTFEYEFFNLGNNSIMYKSIYKILHPQTEIDNADTFLEKLKSNKDKAPFAQILAHHLQTEIDEGKLPDLKISDSFKKAIKWVTRID